MGEFREVNGEALVPIAAWRLGDNYLITKSPGYPTWHVSHVTSQDGATLTMKLVGDWYELTDAVQGALSHRRSRAGR